MGTFNHLLIDETSDLSAQLRDTVSLGRILLVHIPQQTFFQRLEALIQHHLNIIIKVQFLWRLKLQKGM